MTHAPQHLYNHCLLTPCGSGGGGNRCKDAAGEFTPERVSRGVETLVRLGACKDLSKGELGAVITQALLTDLRHRCVARTPG